ncbi:MAG: aromatic ring-hydroxylating oxygenase subunit alpha, partial [Actinomycetota bacterium]
MPPPAPIDRSALEASTRAFHDARTLPAAAYLSEDVLEWERRHFFASSWVCAGRSDELHAAGDQMAIDVAGEGVLLTRADDGELRAFSNTCRHRGHELLVRDAAAINRKVVQCPYHRWVYELDGGFKGGPGLAGRPGFDKADPEHCLFALPANEWHGWVFVNVAGGAPSFEEHVGNLDEIVSPYEPQRLFVGATHRYEVAANWKVIVENYHECYHCSEIHPELCRVSSPMSGEGLEPTGLWIGGTMTLLDGAETMSLDGASRSVRMRSLDDAAERDVGYFMLWPNLLVSPHPDYVMTHRLEPLAPGLTRIECRWLFPPEARGRPDFDPAFASDFW